MRKLSFILICLVLAIVCQARIITVDDNGPADFNNIQAAIDDSNNADTIIIAEGTYTGGDNRNLDLHGKAITIRSTNPTDPCVVAATKIICYRGGRGFYFHSGEGPQSIIEGLTITLGYDETGGAIFCQNSSPTIQRCVLENNISWDFGGAIYCNNSNPSIMNSVLKRNNASYGGAIYSVDSSPSITNSIITNNEAGYGAGIYSIGGSFTVRNCLLIANSCRRNGGAVYCIGGSPSITNSTIANNDGNNLGGAILSDSSSVIVANCILWANTASSSPEISGSAQVTYSDIQDGFTEYGNINADPCFVNPSSGDYHLSLYSPCIDAGDPSYSPIPEETDIDGGPRIRGLRIDMGADEYYFSPIYNTTKHTYHNTIQDAIDNASNGDEIVVSIGTYYENINFKGKNIILRSTEPANPIVVSSTIIDGLWRSSVVTFSGMESAGCVLSGFTITNGFGTDLGRGPLGGAIYGNGTKATIKHNIISRNYALPAAWPGGGSGGGIYDCDGAIQSNIISENETGGSMAPFIAGGGGLANCDGIIENNIIAKNLVWGNYGGSGLLNCNGLIRNNTIFENNDGGIGMCTGAIINCIIWQNEGYQLAASSTPSYCCIQGWSGGGTGNISDNPQLVDPEGGDFHLRPYSPCIDIGYSIPGLTEDFEGDPRPLGAGYDIGADEFIGDNLPPERPINISPSDKEKDVPLTPTLIASAFSDPNPGDTHQASQWHIFAYETGWTVLSITKRAGDLVSFVVPPRTLSDDVRYRWRVRFQDNRGLWSDWSEATDFTTKYTGEVIKVPAHYQTIQSAIDAAIYGDEIVVSPGRYVENINFKGKNIILRSTDPEDSSVVAGTIIDGNRVGSVLTFCGDESSSSVLSGFTITNGSGTYGVEAVPVGGGIFGNYTLATIQNNFITSNTATYGAGLACCNGAIYGNTISFNSAEGKYGASGGGLYKCHGTISYNVIRNNATKKEYVSASGGGLYDCDGTIKNNIISYNSTIDDGGGLCFCDGNILNNVIYCNSAGHLGGGISGSGSRRLLQNCIVWGNSAGHQGSQIYGSGIISFCCIQDWTGGGVGNISSNPLFADPAGGDYHLKSQIGRWDPNSESWVQDELTSPCIDAGDPNSDWTAELWPNGKRINMGAYGGTPQASMSLSNIGNIADLNNDDFVNYNDMMLFTEKWLNNQLLLPEDLDRNGFVNFTDFAIFADNWLEAK